MKETTKEAIKETAKTFGAGIAFLIVIALTPLWVPFVLLYTLGDIARECLR